MSNWGGEYQTLSAAQRTQLAQTLWGDTKFKVLRMWFNTNEFEPTPGARNLTQMRTNYLDSGVVTDALNNGVTELLLAPEKMPPHMDGGEYVLDSQINNYAILIADGIKMMKDQYSVNITATGIQNEPNNTHQGGLDAAFTPAQVVTCVKALRAALDARGLQSVKIIAPESGSADQYLWDCVDALKADSAAWNSLSGISSHSYNIATNDTSSNRIAAADGSNLKDYWQTEASDNGPEAFGMTGVPALRAASLSGRFLNDMNHRVTHWAHFIGFEKPDAGDNGTRIGYYTYPANNFSLTLLKKYYTYKQLGNAFDVGAVFRDSVSSLDGDMMWGWQKKPHVTSAAAKNPDGTWTVGIQNFTADSFSGLQSGGDAWNSEQGGYTPAQSYNVTIKIVELQNTQPITFNITKTTGSVLNASAGTVTMTNGELTIPVNSLDTVTLRSGNIVYNPTPTPTPVPTGKIRFWPRTPYGSRMQYGTFEGTNGDPVSGPWTTLATIDNAATEGQWNQVPAPETITYRYVRYRSAPGGYGNVAEIEFYSNGSKVTGTPYGSAPYAGGSNTFLKAFDNDTSSFFDSDVSEGYAGLDLGVANGASPTVSLTSPANSATFTPGSTINLAATASDSDGTISKVEFYQGTTKLGEDLTSPYTYSWTSVAAGAYALTARATDNSGNVTASSPANITVANPNAPPTVSLTSPTSGATFASGSTISLAANAADSDGTISKVEFFQGGVKLGEDATSPYTYSWTGAPSGTYSLAAKATDNSGATTTSAAVSITVSSPPTGTGTGLKGDYFSTTGLTPLVGTRIDPTINFDWGTSGPMSSVGPEGWSARWTGQVQAVETGTYTFSTISDDGVRLWVNNVQLVNDWNSHPATLNSSTIALTAGQKYDIKLEYYDDTAAASLQLGWIRPGQSTTVIIPQTQLYPPSAGASPTVSLTSPANGATFTAGSTINLTATASDSDGTVSKVEFFQGATKLGEDLTSPYTYSWTGAAAGTYSLTAKATDNTGNITISSAVSITVTAVAGGTGTITRDVWTGISGTAISDVPVGTTPTSTGTLTSFEGPTDTSDNYATRIRGYITAPATGSYTFWVAGDDSVALYLSTNNSPANKVQIAYHNEWTGSREWNKFASQKSATISLTAGTQYYVEVLHKEGAGGDNVAVGWLKPGQTGTVPSEVIPGSVLSPYSAPSNVAPAVSLTSPTNGASFTAGATINLAATASDSDGTISKVEFFQGTTKLGEDLTSPYTYSWTGASAGTYSLTAKATDNAGAVTTSSAVSITVNAPANNPPTVSLTSPTNGSTVAVGSAINLAATASDSDGTVSKVEFFQGATKLGEDLTSPYTYSWTGATAGTYSLTAKATDNSGNVTTSSAVSITVSSGTSSGTVTREVWTGIGGSTVGDIPLGTSPNITDTLSSLEGPSNWADSYGTRIKGYITAPTTGSYTFWIAGDDAGELWLSTNNSASNKVKIASFYQYTGSQNWNAYSVQKSATITLTAGQKYYVEILHKEGAGGDSIAVGWLKPGQTGTVPSEVVPGSVLSQNP